MPAVGQQTIVDGTGFARERPLGGLLIEDSPLIRRSLVEAIDASGELRVTAWADTPETAIALLASQRFDAVIVDLQLKRGSGVEALACLQRTGMTEPAFAPAPTNQPLPAAPQP